MHEGHVDIVVMTYRRMLVWWAGMEERAKYVVGLMVWAQKVYAPLVAHNGYECQVTSNAMWQQSDCNIVLRALLRIAWRLNGIRDSAINIPRRLYVRRYSWFSWARSKLYWSCTAVSPTSKYGANSYFAYLLGLMAAAEWSTFEPRTQVPRSRHI